MQTDRFNRSVTVTDTIEGCFSWKRDPYEVSGAVQTWGDRFPGLPIVADGREKTGWTRKGRGTTAFDLFRSVESRGLIRTDFLSIKTDTIQDDGKLPSKIEVSTGNRATIDFLLGGVKRGSAFPTLIFASSNGFEGEIEERGLAYFLDIAPALREAVADIDAGPYGKGQAPEAYLKWSSARPCGTKGGAKTVARAEKEFPYVDENGRKWISPVKVCYPELVVSLSALGIKREDWIPCSMYDLPRMLEKMDWDSMSFGF